MKKSKHENTFLRTYNLLYYNWVEFVKWLVILLSLARSIIVIKSSVNKIVYGFNDFTYIDTNTVRDYSIILITLYLVSSYFTNDNDTFYFEI